MTRTAVIIVAAGSGLRAGGELPKQYQKIGGRPVIRRTVERLLEHPGIDRVQVVIGEGHRPLFDDALGDTPCPRPVTGGTTRQASVLNGLEALSADPPDLVLIHDAARPFVAPETISHVIAHLDRHEAVVPGLPVADTLKKTRANVIAETIERTGVWMAQTPQGFRFGAILAAHRKAAQAGNTAFTDDASIAEWAGLDVVVIPGTTDNTKITTADDVLAADRKLRMERALALPDVRVGSGFDVHAFEPGDHVTLCGIAIPHDRKLKGHSDADVAMHALTDAIYGALADGDIGTHFPPSESQWKAADSAVFLKAAVAAVKRLGGVIGHCDLTIICEFPKIGPHAAAMRAQLGAVMELDAARVSVKATTSERLGFTGREEGIAAMATVTVRLP